MMLALWAGSTLSAAEAELPPRTVPQRLPCRPIPLWLEDHQRIGHLPGSLPMAEQFLKAGYNVVTLNVLGHWEVVGSSATLYPPERVQQAAQYMRTHVERCHAAGAKAIFYLGPVQVPSGNEIFVRAHPDWLRIRPNGQPDPTPNFANIRSGYAEWLLDQLAYVTREFHVDGFWFDGYAPVHLHTYDDATRQAFREYSGGQELPLPLHDVPDSPMYFDPTRDPLTRLYLRWHEDHVVQFADRMREAIRRDNAEAIIYVNHSANRTWYFPSMYMGEYPLTKAKRNNAWLQPGEPPDGGPLALVASATEVEPLDGGLVISTYNVNLPAEKAGARHPAIIVSEHGLGRVAYFPAAVDKGMFFYPDTYMRQMLANAAHWAAHEASPPVEVAGPLILSATFRAQPHKRRTIVHLLNQASSWGMHSIYQKLAPLPEELSRQWGFPNQSELRGTWPVREEIIPLHDVRVVCRVPQVHKATQQPEGIDLPLVPRPDGVEVTVPVVGMHTLVVFEE